MSKQRNKQQVQLHFTQKIQDYELLNTIGIIDEISQAYTGRHKVNGEIVTIKITDLSISSDYELVQEMIDTVHNTSFVDQERLWTILQPVRWGTMRSILEEHFPNGLPTETLTATIAKEVLKAVAYLHSQQLIHNNIRADNILLDNDGQVKLSGFYQVIDKMQGGQLKKSVYRYVGDPERQAPEVISQATTFNEKADVYSFGITTLELFFGQTPFDQWPALKILLCKLQYEVPVSKEKPITKPFDKFIDHCLNKNPGERSSSMALLQDDAFIKTAKSYRYIETQLARVIRKQK